MYPHKMQINISKHYKFKNIPLHWIGICRPNQIENQFCKNI